MSNTRYGLIDAGVNLASTQFHSDIAAVVSRAREAFVEALVAIGTCPESSAESIRLARQYPAYVFATAGIHPHNADHFDHAAQQQLLRLVEEPEVVAVGEMGLDYNRNFSSPGNQRKAFIGQLDIAAACKKPVYLHERDAFEAQIDILDNYRQLLGGGVAHCFTGSKSQLRQYLDLGFYIGITGWICDPKRGQALREAVSYVPQDRLLLETDAPYLLPRHLNKKQLVVPQRRRNEPCLLPAIASFVANLLGCPVATLCKNSVDNSRRLFKLNPPATAFAQPGDDEPAT